MTSADITRLTPLVEELQRAKVISTYATTSFPWPGEDGEGHYEHGFWISSPGLANRLLVTLPFTEDELVRRIAEATARQNHHTAITATLTQVGEGMLHDLATVYAHRLRGKDVPIPGMVTVLQVTVPLT